jgi:hypothetical protein
MAFSAMASATIITVDGTDYDVSWTIGTFEDINNTYGLVDEAWWGDEALATALATTLGFIDDGDAFPDLGVIFAHTMAGDSTLTSTFSNPTGTFGVFSSIPALNSKQWAFAHSSSASPEPEPVPEPASLALWALGIVGLGFTRKDKFKRHSL